MKEINSKSRLAVVLSKLKGFEKPKVSVEQYIMDSEIGAELWWNAVYRVDIKEKVLVDLGCGTGILGIGALLLGAKKVYFVDMDEKVIDTAKENLADVKSECSVDGEAVFLCQDIKTFNEGVDVVLQNPPFGTKQKHIDRIFLEKAIGLANIVYSFHKTSTKIFVESFAKDNNFEITAFFEFRFPLKQTMEFHRREIHRIDVGCWRLEKKDL